MRCFGAPSIHESKRKKYPPVVEFLKQAVGHSSNMHVCIGTRYGIVLRELGFIHSSEGNPTSACEMFMESIEAYPWNWSAWLDLSAILVTQDINVRNIHLSPA